MVDHFREWLIGQDPMRRGRIWQEMYRGQYFEGGRSITGAMSAIDIALHDIAGKKLGVPVYQAVRWHAAGMGTDICERWWIDRGRSRRDGQGYLGPRLQSHAS